MANNFVANFSLDNNKINTDFRLEKPAEIKAVLKINVTPEKVSQLENDLNFQTEEQVNTAIQQESEVINTRIDEEVERLEEEIGTTVQSVQGSGLIDVVRNEQSVTINSKTYIHEQGISSDVWVIEHNLNKYPTVECVDSAGTVFKAQIEYNSLNSLTVYINGASKGKAYLN